ncbi:MAG: hypothetical protein IKE16_01265 [Solobacterium sp.]|nr:hypothetical protein [Solobacterium sp.]
MDRERFDTTNTEVQMIMVIKLHQLQRETLPTLTYGCLESYLCDELWKTASPRSLHEAADEVLSVDGNELVKFLARKAVLDSKNASLSDFSDLIGG